MENTYRTVADLENLDKIAEGYAEDQYKRLFDNFRAISTKSNILFDIVRFVAKVGFLDGFHYGGGYQGIKKLVESDEQ